MSEYARRAGLLLADSGIEVTFGGLESAWRDERQRREEEAVALERKAEADMVRASEVYI